MKLFIEPSEHPWVTWDKELWKAASSLSTNEKFTIVTSFFDCDAVMVAPKDINKYVQDLDHRMLILYAESLEEFETEKPSKTDPDIIMSNLVVLSPDKRVRDLFIPTATPTYEWSAPSRVRPQSLATVAMKDGGFVITCNCAKSPELPSVIKTYFAMCLNEDTENWGVLTCMQDVDIFSAQELGFEPFNNVHFQGLQPNAKMFKVISNAKAFISPYCGTGMPMNAIDAVLLGTPALVKDTPKNRSIFLDDDRLFYANEEQLAKNIKYFSEVSPTDDGYVKLIDGGIKKLSPWLATNSLRALIYVLRGGDGYE
jgi:hypothetical protein